MKNVLILIVLFFVIRYLRNLYLERRFESKPTVTFEGKQPEARQDRGEEMVYDPVCGHYVPISSAIRIEKDGRAEYFCGPACRDLFLNRKSGDS